MKRQAIIKRIENNADLYKRFKNWLNKQELDIEFVLYEDNIESLYKSFRKSTKYNKKYNKKYFRERYHSDLEYRKMVMEVSKKTQKEKSARFKKKGLCSKCGGKRDRKDRKLCKKCLKANSERLYKKGRKNAYEEIRKIIDKIWDRNDFKYRLIKFVEKNGKQNKK